MEKYFMHICKKFGTEKRCSDTYTKLVATYRTPARFYHTFYGHIAFCIAELKDVPTRLINDRETVAMAIFMHDAFPQSGDEKRSATFATALCREMGMPDTFGEKVANLILSTTHNTCPADNDAKVIIDIDLTIFGQSTEIFDTYEKNIRKEYSHIPADIFARERAKILRRFLHRPFIFLTEYFREKYEKQAKSNLRRSIDHLT
ncbi:MAG: hypothetical protein WC819_04865 [Parcubacteria group bacterium]|jgi:predicted metal-dependent HD superfamily phosphohydrolase